MREALRLLEETGLIRQEKNRGAHVRVIPLSEAADLYDVRAGLDATAGRLLAQRITPEQLRTLRDMTEAMKAVPPDAVDRFHELNLGFHDCIVTMTGNPVPKPVPPPDQVAGTVSPPQPAGAHGHTALCRGAQCHR